MQRDEWRARANQAFGLKLPLGGYSLAKGCNESDRDWIVRTLCCAILSEKGIEEARETDLPSIANDGIRCSEQHLLKPATCSIILGSHCYSVELKGTSLIDGSLY